MGNNKDFCQKGPLTVIFENSIIFSLKIMLLEFKSIERSFRMNILVTLNSGYVPQLIVMLKSLSESNKDEKIKVYVAHSSLEKKVFQEIEEALKDNNIEIINVKLEESLIQDVPITDRYPKEMYYRIFAAHYLPKDLDRILYLDPDIIIINPLKELYNIDFKDSYFAAASHVKKGIQKINKVRLDMEEDSLYINSGVIMMNLKLLRKEQNLSEVLSYIEEHKNMLWLPDQDVISALYGSKVRALDPLIYNLSDRYLALYNINPLNINSKKDLEWVRKNTVIIHYCGRNKPWRDNYIGILNEFYLKYL